MRFIKYILSDSKFLFVNKKMTLSPRAHDTTVKHKEQKVGGLLSEPNHQHQLRNDGYTKRNGRQIPKLIGALQKVE